MNSRDILLDVRFYLDHYKRRASYHLRYFRHSLFTLSTFERDIIKTIISSIKPYEAFTLSQQLNVLHRVDRNHGKLIHITFVDSYAPPSIDTDLDVSVIGTALIERKGQPDVEVSLVLKDGVMHSLKYSDVPPKPSFWRKAKIKRARSRRRKLVK